MLKTMPDKGELAKRMIAFARDLVRIPSLSGEEEAVAHRVAREMRDLAFDEVLLDPMGNVLGRIGSGEGPILLFDAHMDTVGVGDPDAWRFPPFGGEIADGRLYGRGAADMKGPLAAMVYGAHLFAREYRGRGTLYVAAVVQEEPKEGLALKVLLREMGIRPDFVVLGEPSDLAVKRGHRGRLEIRVTTYGRACHASTPWAGENALYAAAKVIFGVELLAPTLADDPVLGRGSIAVTHIHSFAASRNAIPDRVELYIDRRLTLGETEVKALADIRNILQKEGIRGEVVVPEYDVVSYTGYRVRGRESYPAWLLAEDHPFLRRVVHAVEGALGQRPTVGTWRFSTDGVYTMGELGIPTVGFGPGREQVAHTADESVSLRDLERAMGAYARIAEEVLTHAEESP